jgi:hypothetical protein
MSVFDKRGFMIFTELGAFTLGVSGAPSFDAQEALL